MPSNSSPKNDSDQVIPAQLRSRQAHARTSGENNVSDREGKDISSGTSTSTIVDKKHSEHEHSPQGCPTSHGSYQGANNNISPSNNNSISHDYHNEPSEHFQSSTHNHISSGQPYILSNQERIPSNQSSISSLHPPPEASTYSPITPLHSVIRDYEDDEEVDELTDSTEEDGAFPDQTLSRKRCMLALFCVVHCFYGAYYAMLGPFLPALCDDKNLTSTMIGVLMGVFEWFTIISAVIYGKYISAIGAKFMYLTGTMSFGYCVFLMGLLEYCPPDATFVVTTIGIRVCENLAVSAILTAAFAIIARAYPDNVASMFGVLELCNGVGMMIGPVFGGALHDAGGFHLPFFVMGSMIMLVGFVGCFLVPSLDGVTVSSSGKSMFALMRIPSIVVMMVIVFVASSVMSFYDVALSVFLEYKFDLTAVMMGVVFMVGSGMYAITAPAWGRIAEKKPHFCSVYIVFGFLLAGLSLQFLGPAPFIPIRKDLLWLVYVSQAICGVGIGTLVVTFEVVTTAASEAGHPDNLDTFGLISGLWNAVFAFGAFGGAVGGGLLNDYVGFEWSSSIFGMILVAAALLVWVFSMSNHCYSRRHVRETEEMSSEETEDGPLLINAATGNGNAGNHIGRARYGAL